MGVFDGLALEQVVDPVADSTDGDELTVAEKVVDLVADSTDGEDLPVAE